MVSSDPINIVVGVLALLTALTTTITAVIVLLVAVAFRAKNL